MNNKLLFGELICRLSSVVFSVGGVMAGSSIGNDVSAIRPFVTVDGACFSTVKSVFQMLDGSYLMFSLQSSGFLENALPTDFQFEVIDNLGDGSITLKREYDVEQIQAIVYVNFDEDEGGNDNENEEDDSGSEDKNNTQNSSISLVVTIDKTVGPTLEFCCNLAPNDFEIGSMSLKSSENSDEDYYQGPDFSCWTCGIMNG